MSSLFSRALLVQGLTRCGRSPDHGRARSEDCIVSLTNGGPSCPQIVEKIQGTPVWPSRNDRHKQKSSAPQAFLVPTSARVPRRLDARLRGHDGLVKCGQYIIGAGPLEISHSAIRDRSRHLRANACGFAVRPGRAILPPCENPRGRPRFAGRRVLWSPCCSPS